MINSIEQLLDIYNVKTELELDWVSISRNQTLSEAFIEKHSDKVSWGWISIHQKLSESFIEKHSDKVDWKCVSIYQKLSESFIEKFADKVNWKGIAMYQTLSETFILKYWDRIPMLSLVKDCGNESRNIYRLKESPEIIRIGCFSGTQEETIKAIKEKYKKDPVAMQQYINKVELCFNTTLID